VNNAKYDRLTPRFVGSEDFKNQVDSLRRKLSTKRLKQIIISDRDGYRLHPRVKVLGSGQIGIRKTKR